MEYDVMAGDEPFHVPSVEHIPPNLPYSLDFIQPPERVPAAIPRHAGDVMPSIAEGFAEVAAYKSPRPGHKTFDVSLLAPYNWSVFKGGGDGPIRTQTRPVDTRDVGRRLP